MKNDQQKKSFFKVLVCSLCLTAFSSFVPPDCKFTTEQINHFCEDNELWECKMTWTGGPCAGESTTYNAKKPKV
jgi:hypothetical protein